MRNLNVFDSEAFSLVDSSLTKFAKNPKFSCMNKQIKCDEIDPCFNIRRNFHIVSISSTVAGKSTCACKFMKMLQMFFLCS